MNDTFIIALFTFLICAVLLTVVFIYYGNIEIEPIEDEEIIHNIICTFHHRGLKNHYTDMLQISCEARYIGIGICKNPTVIQNQPGYMFMYAQQAWKDSEDRDRCPDLETR